MKICLMVFLCIAYMHTLYTMQAPLENELGTLQRNLTDLKNTLQPTPAPSARICKGRQGKRGGKRHHRRQPRTPEGHEHAKIRRTFRELQRKAGIQPPQYQRRRGAATWRGAKRPQRTQRSQADRIQLNKTRSALNTLLEKEYLNEVEQQEFNQRVNELEKLKPHRWPRAEDYKALYTKKYQP